MPPPHVTEWHNPVDLDNTFLNMIKWLLAVTAGRFFFLFLKWWTTNDKARMTTDMTDSNIWIDTQQRVSCFFYLEGNYYKLQQAENVPVHSSQDCQTIYSANEFPPAYGFNIDSNHICAGDLESGEGNGCWVRYVKPVIIGYYMTVEVGK